MRILIHGIKIINFVLKNENLEKFSTTGGCSITLGVVQSPTDRYTGTKMCDFGCFFDTLLRKF